eukprot:6464728-Amphidinium_carterae.1
MSRAVFFSTSGVLKIRTLVGDAPVDEDLVEGAEKHASQKHLGYMKYAAEVLCDEKMTLYWSCMVHVPTPTESYFNRLMGEQKIVERRPAIILSWSAVWPEVLASQLLHVLQPGFMRESGLLRASQKGVQCVGQAAGKAWEVCYRFVGEQVRSYLLWQTPPWSLLSLLRYTGDELATHMQRLKHEYETVTEMERASATNVAMQSYLSELALLRSQWLREVWLRLEELLGKHRKCLVSFRNIWDEIDSNFSRETGETSWQPDGAVTSILTQWLHSIWTSLPVEHGFRDIRIAERGSRNKDISESSMWHRVSYGPVLGSWGVELPNTGAQPQRLASELVGWNADKEVKSTVPEIWWHDFVGRVDWKSSTSTGYRDSLVQWAVMKRHGRDWPKISHAWLSVLATPGTLLCSTASRQAGVKLVLHSCSRGYVAWKCTWKKESKRITLSPDPEKAIEVDAVTDIKTYRLCAVDVVVPECIDGNMQEMQLGIKMRDDGQSMLKFHAAEGFKTLTPPQMHELAVHLKLDAPKGRPAAHESQLVELLVRESFGRDKCTDEQLKMALSRRGLLPDEDLAGDIAVDADRPPDSDIDDIEPDAEENEEIKEAWAERAKLQESRKQKSMSGDDMFKRVWQSEKDKGVTASASVEPVTGQSASSSTDAPPASSKPTR